MAGASVCVYELSSGGKGAKITAQSGSTPAIANGCVTTGSDGTYVFMLPAAAPAALLVESTGGTWCSDESVFNGSTCAGGGTPVAMGSNVLRTVAVPAASGSSTANLTLLTTAATQSHDTLTRSTFESAYATIASNFNAPIDPAAAPASGELGNTLHQLARYVGLSTADLADILSGIAAGTLVASNTQTYPAGVEFAVGLDQKVARLFTVTSSAVNLVSTASLPGIPGSYSRSGSTVTVTMPRHGIRDGMQIPLAFSAGAGGTATSGTYKVRVLGNDIFTVTDTAAGDITAGTLLRDPVTTLSGTYRQRTGDHLLEVTIPDHGLTERDAVELKLSLDGGLTTELSASVSYPGGANTFFVRLDAAATSDASGSVTARVGTNWTAFDVVMHPSGKWLYVSSGYECSYPYCWGGDVITTFSIDWTRGKLNLVRAIRTQANNSYGIPVTMAINPAGTQMAIVDQGAPALVLWGIDAATGALTRLSSSNEFSIQNHGAVFSADGRFVYNGARAFSIAQDTIASTSSGGSGGNGGEIIDSVLFFSQPGRDGAGSLFAYSLENDARPNSMASIDLPSTNRSVSTRNGSLIVASGTGGIKTYTFGGLGFDAANPLGGSGELQRDGAATLGDASMMYRSVNLNRVGDIAVASYFANPRVPQAAPQGGPPSGYLFATVGADGALVRIADLPVAQFARVAKFVKQP